MFDAVTYGAAVGAAKRYTDEQIGSDDAVKYTEQSLTTAQQAQARENIGAAASTDVPTDAVKYTAQTLTDAQKAQARANIGAVGGDDNKLRLGQIWGMKFSSSSSTAHAPVYGFNSLFGSLSSITFQSNTISISSSAKVYQFGDFIGFISSDAVTVQPISGKRGYPTTGRWMKVENCYCMFYGCTALTSLDLSNFDTSNVETCNNMFYNCSSLTSLDLSSFDTSKVTDMSQMFYNCTTLATLDISSFDMTNVVAYTDMFGSSVHSGITTLKCPKINPHDDIPLPRTLYSQDGTAYTNLPVTTGTSIELRQSWT